MTPEYFSYKWFVFYYPVLALLFLLSGLFIMARFSSARQYLVARASEEKPPDLLIKFLKYWFLFTIPCLVLSLIPVSWPELLFSVWCFVMIYILGSLLSRWNLLSEIILDYAQDERLNRKILQAGVIMVSLSLIIVILEYRLINQIHLFK